MDMMIAGFSNFVIFKAPENSRNKMNSYICKGLIIRREK